METHLRLLPQFSINSAEHGDVAGQTADNVGNRLGQKHAHRTKAHHRQQQRQRHDDDHLAQQRKRDGMLRPAQRLKNALPAELKALEEETRKIHADHFHAGLDQRSIRRKQFAQNPRLEHRKQPCAEGIKHAHGGHEPNAVAHALHLPRAVVVAEHRTRTLGDAADRQGEHLADGVDDRHHADIEIAAVDREHFVAGDLHQRVGEFHDEPHHAEAQNILQQIRTDMHLPDLQRQNRLRAGQEAEHPDAADCLADDRRHRRARHAHVKHIDEQRIEHKVHRRAEHRRHHAHLRTPLRVDERIQARRQHGKRRAEQIDLQICVRIDKRILARAEEKQQRPLDGVAKRHQRQRRNQQQRIHRALNLQSVRLILPPARHRENRRAARTVQAGERRHDGNDGENQADAGQAPACCHPAGGPEKRGLQCCRAAAQSPPG